MSEIQNKLRRTWYKTKRDFLTTENVILILAIILCLVWTYQSISAMSRNWNLSEKLITEKKHLELLTAETEAAELENAYYESAEYQELMARKYLDKKLPGENMVVMPENSETAQTKHQTAKTEPAEKEYTNFEKWWLFLFPKV